MKLAEVNPAVVREIWSRCASRIPSSQWLDESASLVVGEIYARLSDSLVLLRAFITVPAECLPERQRAFATALAQSANLLDSLRPNTPVHSLLATRGCIDEWNDPGKSRRHVAIPLLSEAFVGEIPMMSRLLRELGLPLTWSQDPRAGLVGEAIGSEVGFFYVGDAVTAEDELKRKIIPAQEFVSNYGVRSVFAVGGTVFGGALLVLIFFSRDQVDARTVRTFMPIINLLKAAMVPRWSPSRIFRPDPEDLGNESIPVGER